MHIIEQFLLASLKPFKTQPLVIAYSGGVDSQVLLFALSQLQKNGYISNKITACHIHHGLSDNADNWLAFCHQQTQRLGVEFVYEHVQIKPTKQQSLEALARHARYQAFQQLTPSNAVLLTGHHQDDQAETFLLALKRGSGISGLGAMKQQITLFERSIVRPFLDISRQQVVDYAEEHHLSHIDDDSNTDERFDRNFIRHSILPALEQRWPSIKKTIVRSADNCQQAQSLLDEVAEDDLAKISTKDTNTLLIEGLSSLSTQRFNNVLRYKLKQVYNEIPSAGQLAQIKSQLNAEHDKTPAVELVHVVIRRFNQRLYITPKYQNIQKSSFELTKRAEDIALPDGKGVITFKPTSHDNEVMWQVKAPKPEQKVLIKFCHDNPKCLPDYRQHSKPLKKILQELKIAPWQRTRIPFLYYDNELVAALGYFVCKQYKPSDEVANLTLYTSFSDESG